MALTAEGLTIARHCVASDPQTGLSPLQQALLDEPARVRIASAPTGAGKSYAFQRGMARAGQRVLFVVPTKRLAQNLAAGLLHDLATAEHWSEAQAQDKVVVWSADQSEQLRRQGVTEIAGHRIRELQALDPTREGGEMIIAIPEVVSYLLVQRRLQSGQAAVGILDLLALFDHIVFDEFHTIGPRGFGLAAVCALLAATQDWARARVSFLSATPVEIRPVLARLGVPEERMLALEEAVGDEGRPLHGDVRLELSEAPSLAALLASELPVMRDALKADSQAVVIYDRLGDLQRELPELARVAANLNIPKTRVLLINSIDDSASHGRTSAGFATGRHHDPDDFDLLLATSSVEMGVTFRAADLLFMEPGFDPLGFLQRYGRAARRGRNGQVRVRIDQRGLDAHRWQRRLRTWVQDNSGGRVGIDALTGLLSRECRDAFAAPADEQRHFGTLPARAAFTAGLYWNALVKHKAQQGHRGKLLRAQRPAPAAAIYAWLAAVRRMAEDRMIGHAATHWCDRFERLAYGLRDIGPRILVIEGDGKRVEPGVDWLRRETDLMERLPVTLADDGRECIRLPQGVLNDYLLDQRNRIRSSVSALFPHTSIAVSLPDDSELVAAWCRDLRDMRNPASLAWDDYPEAMVAAEKLVRTTGLVPCDDQDLSLGASHGVL